MPVIERRGGRIVADAARRQRVHRVGAYQVVRPRPHPRQAVPFQDVLDLGVGLGPAAQRLLGGLVRKSAAAQHLLRDTDGVAGGRRRPEHAFIVVLRQDEDRQP